MEYHKFLRDIAVRSNALLAGKSQNQKVDAQFHFTKKFIHLTFLMTMTFDRLRQVDNFEGDERSEIVSLQTQYNRIRHWIKKDFSKSNEANELNFSELFNLDTWFYYRLEQLPPAPIPILIESLKEEDDQKTQITLDQLLSCTRNAVAHGQVDFGSKPGVMGRDISFIYFCSELKGKNSNGDRTIIGRVIVALDERALEALIKAWHEFVLNSSDLHKGLQLFERTRS